MLTWFCIQVVNLWETAIEASTSCSVGYGNIGNSVLALDLQDLERKRRERLKVRMHHRRVEQDDHFPLLASNAMLGAPQETVGPPSCQGALLHIINLVSIKTPRSLSAAMLTSISSLR